LQNARGPVQLRESWIWIPALASLGRNDGKWPH
jgi:hypothetical protein